MEDALGWYRDVTGTIRENNIAFCHWEYKYKGGFPILDEDLEPLQPLVEILTE